MDSPAWLRRFLLNASRPRPDIPAILGLPPHLHVALLHSLQRFQLGETGEGTIVHQAESSRDPVFDAATQGTIALWVREEGRHAAELADVLRALGSQPLRRHYSQSLFKKARRLFGLPNKLLAIAVAEIVGIVFYRMLRDEVPCEALSELAKTLVRDEEMHLEFLGDFFARTRALSTSPRWEKVRIEIGVSLILAGAVTTLAIDQRAFFRAMGVSPVELFQRCFAVRSEMLAGRAEGPYESRGLSGDGVATRPRPSQPSPS